MKLYRNANGWFLEKNGQFALLPMFSLGKWLGSLDSRAMFEQVLASADFVAGAPEKFLAALAAPIDYQEVWAAGVTYQRSKTARMEESNFSATAYDRVYDAPRPELFFKATAQRCSGPNGRLRLRDDSKWMVPEPELTLVIDRRQRLVGYTIGNDLSCRDIEGENLLYLPQAKVWDQCCGLGPCILLAEKPEAIRSADISLQIRRGGETVFSGSTSIGRIKRSFEELIEYLFRNHTFSDGVFLLTGTGIVPPDNFTLARGDEVRITVEPIGTLANTCH